MEKKEDIYTFKPDFTKEEVNELVDWFDARMDKLPQELQINKSSKTTNLRFTVSKLISLVKGREISVTICGYIAHLAMVQKRLQQSGME